MLNINVKKILLCLFSFFSCTSCMEITQLPKDAFTPIAGQLTLIERHYLRNSCKDLRQKLSEELLFLSPFNSENYHKFISIQCNYLPLEQIASAHTILKLKIFAARHKEDKEKKMFFDLMTHYPEKSCTDEDCVFNYKIVVSENMVLCNQNIISLYKKKWNNQGNLDHFKELIDAVKIDCRSLFDLALVQGIDVNATNENGKTVLHKTCKKDCYAWATRKLVSHKLCNINAITHNIQQTPLHVAAMAGSGENIKILLTGDGVEMRTKNAFNYYGIAMSYKTYQLLCATDRFQCI